MSPYVPHVRIEPSNFPAWYQWQYATYSPDLREGILAFTPAMYLTTTFGYSSHSHSMTGAGECL